MSVNFNGQVSDQLPLPLEQMQRALFYGDGLFESIRVFDDRIPLLKLHWNRLVAGAEILGLHFSPAWNIDFFENEIQKIASANARVRLMVWRAPGGLYQPLDDTALFLITAIPLANPCFDWLEPGITVGISNSVQLPVDALSNCKTLNAERYIMAARDAEIQGWDDALICNVHGRISEATSSNIFWLKDETLYTVPLSEGCVAGVMRQFLIGQADSTAAGVEEKAVSVEQLQQADEIFLTNAVRGMVSIRNFAGKILKNKQSRLLFDALRKSICI